MLRVVTAVFGLLLVLSGGVTVPASRVETARDSSAIVWIDRRGAEEAQKCEHSSSIRPVRCGVIVEYRSRVISHRPAFDLFQRPPPHIA
jgi:hypothetical protein